MMPSKLSTHPKPTEFVGSALDELKSFPDEVKDDVGFAIYVAQIGGRHPSVKPLTAGKFKGEGVVEIIDDHDGNTYRVAYTIKFELAVYVLCAFQKKSKKGISTPKADLDRILNRLKIAREHYAQNYAAKLEEPQ